MGTMGSVGIAQPQLVLKGCRRCAGDLYRGWDGEYLCLQCGRTQDWQRAKKVQWPLSWTEMETGQ